jgi:hypothetical protein
MIKNYIFIGLILTLVVFGLIMSIKCSSLERENIKLRVEHNAVIDSINVKNEALETNILLLEEELVKCSHEIDSLKKLKQRVIVKYKYVISNDLTEGVSKLKENLKCEVY